MAKAQFSGSCYTLQTAEHLARHVRSVLGLDRNFEVTQCTPSFTVSAVSAELFLG